MGKPQSYGLKGSPWLADARINMVGPEVEDFNDTAWLGDELGVGDALNIRPIDARGTNYHPELVRGQPRDHRGPRL